jgi:hypothetical protein
MAPGSLNYNRWQKDQLIGPFFSWFSQNRRNPQAIQRELVPQSRAFRIGRLCGQLEVVLGPFLQSLTEAAGHKESTVHPFLPM